MEYYQPMHTVVEIYLKDADAIFTMPERETIVTMIALDPDAA